MIGDQETRNVFIRDIMMSGGWDVYITSCEMILREKSIFKNVNWKYMVIEEAYRIKNGESINLYTAEVLILYNGNWNLQMDLQAMDRAHRIGQKKQVGNLALPSPVSFRKNVQA